VPATFRHGDEIDMTEVLPVEQPPVADEELWAAVRRGDRDAFTALYHRHAEAVWQHAYRLTASRTAAEDVLAATFLTAWRRRGDVVFAADSARPWLLAVAANEARTEWRRATRRRRLSYRLGPAPDVDDHAETVVTSLDDRRKAHRVMAAIEKLPATQRDAVTLCLVAEVSQADAARVLGIPEATLRSHIHRARARLRTVLPEEVR
jgi:RNA polymerase sigma-70 factor (ECF subfamily)